MHPLPSRVPNPTSRPATTAAHGRSCDGAPNADGHTACSTAPVPTRPARYDRRQPVREWKERAVTMVCAMPEMPVTLPVRYSSADDANPISTPPTTPPVGLNSVAMNILLVGGC